MKRLKFCILVLIITLSLISSCACEEPFSFRNGIQFNMDTETIKKIEDSNGQIKASDGWLEGELPLGNFLLSEKVKVSSYYANTFIYIFQDGKMKVALYGLFDPDHKPEQKPDEKTEMFETLSSALIHVYGEPENADINTLDKLLHYIKPDFTQQELNIENAKIW